ncbi:MAG: FAD-dependent oxidoreductase [Defluviitaleaceae bacterium]|nr:FAD-dependent oxidoreductase [Defluviitaleaceae bacterium]
MKILINGVECQGHDGQTVLQVATAAGIFIPTLCYGEGLAPSGACGVCVVEGDTGLLRACATAARDGMVISTDSARVLATRKTLLELAVSAHSGDCKAPCQVACPAGSDCQGYIALIAAGKLREAVELMKEAHPFPASVARICPRPCETECRRKLADEPINIAGLKGFAADVDLDDAEPYIPEISPANGHNIAIVGAGPGGLTAAYFLRRAGYTVSVFERLPKPGGLLRYGIPEYRLPKAIVDAEIEILRRMGIQFFNGVGLGRDITLQFLQAKYDAVILATGAGISKPILCEGEDAEGVFGGIDFLNAVANNKPPKIGRRVVVVGGSNTAMDAARTAMRLGAEVTVAYRRTRDEMPAEEIEVQEAVAEGVQFSFLTAPMEIVSEKISENSRVKGIKLQKMQLGEPDESGRRAPVPVEGGEEFIEADTIIAAIGQDVSIEGLTPLESFNVDEKFRTNLPKVYAIGDATGKSQYAIHAIGHGRNVAAVVHEDIYNVHVFPDIPDILIKTEKTTGDFKDVPKLPRQNGQHFVQKTPLDFTPVPAGLTPTEAAHEAARCLSCGCADYYECKLIRLANAYDADTDAFPEKFHKRPKHTGDQNNFNFHRDMNKCVLCGLCARICDTLSAVNRGFDTTVSAAYGKPLQNRDECTMCGNCVNRCPVGALTEVSPLPKPLVTKEEITETTCTFCEKGCGIKIAAKAGQVLRCLPNDITLDEKSMCEQGKFGFRRLGDKLIAPLIKKDDLLRRASLPEAAKAVREGLNVLIAQYGAESIGVVISPSYMVEDVSAIVDYAVYLGTPNIFTFADTSKKTHCNTAGLKKFGVSTENEKYFKKIREGEIKGLIVFGDDLPFHIAELPLEFLVIQTAYTSALLSKPARNANVIFPAPAFGEIQGHVINEKTGQQLRVNPAFPPACGFQTRQLIPFLSDLGD